MDLNPENWLRLVCPLRYREFLLSTSFFFRHGDLDNSYSVLCSPKTEERLTLTIPIKEERNSLGTTQKERGMGQMGRYKVFLSKDYLPI